MNPPTIPVPLAGGKAKQFAAKYRPETASLLRLGSPRDAKAKPLLCSTCFVIFCLALANRTGVGLGKDLVLGLCSVKQRGVVGDTVIGDGLRPVGLSILVMEYKSTTII
jgi:hypothetical protein